LGRPVFFGGGIGTDGFVSTAAGIGFGSGWLECVVQRIFIYLSFMVLTPLEYFLLILRNKYFGNCKM
jgi:hypothetical protein